MRKISFAALSLIAAAIPAHAQDSDAAGSKAAPPMLGIVRPRDWKPAVAPAATAGNMTYHGGKIMPTVTSKAIFWGTSWATYTGDVITGLDSWYVGHNGSNYAKTVNEYTGTNGQVGSSGLVHQGHIIDSSTAASTGGNSSTILAEVCKQITNGNLVPDLNGNGYYPVYVDKPRAKFGSNSQYCAWHSAGTCTYNGQSVAVQFAFFYSGKTSTGATDTGCSPSDTVTGHSAQLASLANVTAHELSEARSDPASPSAWYDASGYENGDKCAWTFNVPYVTFPNGTQWKLQGEWSNAAYTAGTGYPNSSGQNGCLDGH